jgi:hypothetical protein
MQIPPKHSKARQELIFHGLRWPGAYAAGAHHQIIPRADGSLARESRFVNITGAIGKGRRWTPEPTDATWKNLAELDLDSFPDSAHFVQRRGDPYGALKPIDVRSLAALKPSDFHFISTAQWIHLAEALRLAAVAWQPPDASGISYPTKDRAKLVEAGRFLQHPGAAPMVTTLTVVPNSSGLGLSFSAPTMAAFLIARAALALANPLPMRKCAECGFWFEMRRIRQPRFCSSSCRALNHQNREIQNGVSSQEHHPEGDHAVAIGMATASAGRKDAAADPKLRQPKGSPRSRPAHGDRGRAKRHRRPAKA